MNPTSAIPFFSAAAVNRSPAIAAAVERVLASHWYVMGAEVTAFEAEFAASIGVAHCVSVANGSDALEIALRALGVGAGSRVVTVANAGFYGSTAAHIVGATPLYVEVDASTLTLCPRALEAALARKPAVVIATHLYGQLAAIEQIAQACRFAGIPLIEDCAQSHGARRGGKVAGSFGDVACYSFYPTKNLGALGDGGAVLTSDPALADRLRALRQYGWSRKYTVSIPGGRNSRLDELQAAVLRAKLPLLAGQNAQRRTIAARYNESFRGLPLQCPASTGEDFVAHLYVVRTVRREALRAHLSAAGIATDIHYPLPDTKQPAYAQALAPQALPVTESACDTVLSLPCYPGLADEAVQRVIDAVRAFFAAGA